ncbi:SCL-interrupting locus protein [Rhinophrynus dorsalis]
MSNRMLPLGFPPSKTVLWDSTPMGDAIGLHFSYYRNPRLLVSEKALRLSYRHAKTERKLFSCFLLGTFSVDEDEEGVTLSIDRFDPGREKSGGQGKVPTALLPGDFVIPCSIGLREGSGNIVVHTHEDCISSFMGLQSHLHSKEALDLSKLLTVRAHITYSENMDNLDFDLHWAAITAANTFESTPIKPVPIIPTALARNLSSHNNIAQLQGTHKCGYLTMDQTRKLLLVLESDPKVYMLPLVGIWLSGVTHVHSPQVWSSCLRFMYSSSFNERVLSESGSFLIVLYSLTHKEPEFYECTPCIGHEPFCFQLLTCEDALHLFKNVEASRKSHFQFELSSECNDSDAYLFQEASKSTSATVFKNSTSPNKLSISDHDSGVEDEDFSPRPSPRPHPSVQQVTRIHPSVPELSLVFGSFIDSNSASRKPENTNKNMALSSTQQNASYTTNEPQLCDNQTQDAYLKARATHLHSAVPMTKTSKGRSSPADNQTSNLKSNHQIRRNSASSSSSLSTPRSGLSPDTSVHQVKGSSEQGQCCHTSRPRQGPPLPLRRSSTSSIQKSSPHSPSHNVTFPLQPRHLAEATKLVPNSTPFHQPNVCNCCHNPSPFQCQLANAFPVTGHLSYNAVEKELEPTYQNMGYPSLHCSPVCVANFAQSTGKLELCSPVDHVVLSPGRRESLAMDTCSPHSCAHASHPVISSTNGMLGLSTEAYQLLAEQDKQLKLLQAQIQRLLEAQTSQAGLAPVPVISCSAEKQTESVSTETSVHEMRKSVSIAVSTGASLFWNNPCPEEEGCVDKQDDSALCNEFSVNVNNEDTSHTSITSSLKAVDICSFSESTQLTDSGNNFSPALLHDSHERNEPCSMLPHESPVSTSVSIQAENPGNQCTTELSKTVPCVPPEKFYQDLLSQVNNLLKTSTSVEEDSCSKEDLKSGSIIYDHNTGKGSTSLNENQNEHSTVLKATLKQLKTLGVNIEMDTLDKKTGNSDTAENASILACINPEAVIPRLNYMSFTNVGLSGFVPSGVDLSMEANAIALKYLNESQLSQLSVSHASKNRGLDPSYFHSLLPRNTEKSMVGLSLISPSNMSFATKKYMKRYGLIESNDSSDEEPDLPMENSSDKALTLDNHLGENTRSFPDHSYSEEIMVVNDGPKQNKNTVHDAEINPTETNKLRNITNEISGKCLTATQPSEEMSLQFFKELKSKTKFSSGKTQFTRHPEKENTTDPLFFHPKDSSYSGKRSPSCPASVGDILDVNRLRQLPKLF